MRVVYGISQCFAEVPDKALFQASVDDPKLGEYLYTRQKSMSELDRMANGTSRAEGIL